MCDKRAECEDELKKHVQSTHITKEATLLKCEQCNYTSATLSDLKRHQENNHTEDTTYLCDQCDFTTPNDTEMDNHMARSHTGKDKTKFSCEICQIETNTAEKLRAHYDSEHETPQHQDIFACDECNFEAETAAKVKEHSKIHLKTEASVEANVACDKCEYVAESANDLATHRRSEHSYFVYHCGHCQFNATNTEILRSHTQKKHGAKQNIIRKQKLFPLPVCDPSSQLHSSDCCDARKPGNEKPKIYSQEERYQNGVCLEWNKGYCRQEDLCRFDHTEILECRYGRNCLRSDCYFWHGFEGKFPFLG